VSDKRLAVAAAPPQINSDSPLLDVDSLTVRDRHNRPLTNRISFAVAPGEAIAIVGESGSGKSLTARALTGLLPPRLSCEGSALLEGRQIVRATERDLRQMRGRAVSLLMQDPFTMLHPLRKVSANFDETLIGTRRAKSEETRRRLEEVRITDPTVADRYPFELSGGMRQRVALAAALARDPQLLIADEPTTALDVTTQRTILELLRNVQQRRGMGLILITHDINLAFSTCDRVLVFYAGSIVEEGPTQQLAHEPAHPYTWSLLKVTPTLDGHQAPVARGGVPHTADVLDICAFAARCPYSLPVCRAQKPPLREVTDGRLSACVRYEEINRELRLDEPLSANAMAVAERSRTQRPPVLVVERLHKDYRRRRNASVVTALDDVSLEVAEAESIAIVGESGSGKTTLARCILGLAEPTNGSIVVQGIDITHRPNLSAEQRATVCRTIQCVFQDPYTSLNPAHTVRFTLQEAVRQSDETTARTPLELLDLVGLPTEFADRRPAALSGGQRQRVAIARALAVSPRLLICDEPTASLDVSVQGQIIELLRDLNLTLGTTLLFITHDLAVVRQIATRAAVMRNGQVVEIAPVDQLLSAPRHEYTKQLISAVPRRP
jgi:peptide/nickel transport system ATP-binding protein